MRIAGMRWKALATDFDGTIATDGVVDEPTREALMHLQRKKVCTILVTGRELVEFRSLGVFLQMFDMIVAENGALLYNPFTEEIKALGAPPSESFLTELSRKGVPFSVGASIVATVEPHEVAVLETIKDMGLELQVIFNKGAVMILPSGINKASGLLAALKECGVDPAEVVGVGDAENDHAFLEVCGLPVAVANALPALKGKASLVTEHSAGAGVVELIEKILNGDLDNHPAAEVATS